MGAAVCQKPCRVSTAWTGSTGWDRQGGATFKSTSLKLVCALLLLSMLQDAPELGIGGPVVHHD